MKLSVYVPSGGRDDQSLRQFSDTRSGSSQSHSGQTRSKRVGGSKHNTSDAKEQGPEKGNGPLAK